MVGTADRSPGVDILEEPLLHVINIMRLTLHK